jgi:hypothetical protein
MYFWPSSPSCTDAIKLVVVVTHPYVRGFSVRTCESGPREKSQSV